MAEELPCQIAMSALPYPPLRTESKFIVLSDWVSCPLVSQRIFVDLAQLPVANSSCCYPQDGTITDKDSNDYMTDNMGGGVEFRSVLDGSHLYTC